MVRKIFAAAAAAGVFCAFGAERVFSAGNTVVAEAITGDDSVVVDCGSGNWVSFTAANTFTGGIEVRSGMAIVSNLAAFAESGAIKVHSGAAVRVCVDYTGSGKTLREAVTGRIEVQGKADGSEPWVSVQLMDAGLANDVDFTDQPHLWLGAPSSGDWAHPFTGTYTPEGTTYRFGYAGGSTTGEARGLQVSALGDGPGGESRSVIVRGGGNTYFKPANANSFTYTGSLTVEGATVSTGDGKSFAADNVQRRVVLRKGARVNSKGANGTYGANISFEIDGTNIFHSCGASYTVTTKIKGPVSGWGLIRLTDQGGMEFHSAANMYTGGLKQERDTLSVMIPIVIGDGANCSWAGDAIEQMTGKSNQTVTVNCNGDFTLATDLMAGGGRLVKKGSGTLSLARPFLRGVTNPKLPLVEVSQGRLKLLAEQPAGGMSGHANISYGAVLDLNNLRHGGIWLPYGMGTVENVHEDGATAYGKAPEGEEFNGTVKGNLAVCELPTGCAWRMGPDAVVEGTLDVRKGEVEMLRGAKAAAVSTGPEGRLVAGGGSGLARAMRVYIWKNASTGSANTREEFGKSLNSVAGRNPDIVADMGVFGETFRSDDDAAGLDKKANSAFAKIIGAAEVNTFVARFIGWFEAEADGEYVFTGEADDMVRVEVAGREASFGAYGATPADTPVTLAKGKHRMVVDFVERSGDEIVRVKYKAPGMPGAQYLPLRLLSVAKGESADVRVTGEGTLELKEGGTWPEWLDASGFEGKVSANAAAGSEGAGRLELGTATVAFEPAAEPGLGDAEWEFYGAAAPFPDGRALAADFCGAQYLWGAVNSAVKFDLAKDFALEFDLTAENGGSHYIGDGLALVLHNGNSIYFDGTFSQNATIGGSRLGGISACGVHAYLTSHFSELAVVCEAKLAAALEKDFGGSAFWLQNSRKEPIRAKLLWSASEGLKMELRRTVNGEEVVWSKTHPKSAAEIKAKFPQGAAAGLWFKTGGYWGKFTVKGWKAGDPGAEATPQPSERRLGGELGLGGGTLTLVRTDGYAGEAAFAADLDVKGPAAIVNADEAAVKVEPGTWRFDLADAQSSVAWRGAYSFEPPAGGKVRVALHGEFEGGSRVLADFTEAGEAADALDFELAPGGTKGVKLVWKDRKLKVSGANGTVLIVR